MRKARRLDAPVVIGLFITLGLASVSRSAMITLFTDEAAWESTVQSFETFFTTRTNVSLSTEGDPDFPLVGGNNDLMSGTLTYASGATGLSRSFRVQALEYVADFDFGGNFPEFGGHEFTFGDRESGGISTSGSALGGFGNALSPNDINNGEDDDVRWEILSGPPVTAFAFSLGHSGNTDGESVRLLSGGTELGIVGGLPTGGSFSFIGLTSDVPFNVILFDENTDNDDVSVANFRFGVFPEPATGILLGTMMVLAAGRRHRQARR